METIAQKLNKVLQTKAALKEALALKGASVNDATPFADYPALLRLLSAAAAGGEAAGSFLPAEFDNLSAEFYAAASLFLNGAAADKIDTTELPDYEKLVFSWFAGKAAGAADVNAAALSPAERFKFLLFLLQKGADILGCGLSDLDSEQRFTLLLFSVLLGRTVTTAHMEGLDAGRRFTLLLFSVLLGRTVTPWQTDGMNAGQLHTLLFFKLYKNLNTANDDVGYFPDGGLLSFAAHTKTADAANGMVLLKAPDADFLPVLQVITGEKTIEIEPEYLPDAGVLTDWLKKIAGTLAG
jgi:hypothetical protein